MIISNIAIEMESRDYIQGFKRSSCPGLDDMRKFHLGNFSSDEIAVPGYLRESLLRQSKFKTHPTNLYFDGLSVTKSRP